MKQFLLAQLFIVSILSPVLKGEVHVLPSPKFVTGSHREISFQKISANFGAALNDSASLIELRRYFGKTFTNQRKSKHEVVISVHLVSPVVLKAYASIPVAISDSLLVSDEAYLLVAGDHRIDIFAKSRAGVFYAVTTFLQLVVKQRNVFRFPEIEIADYPSLRMRGISDDISRGQISTMENFKKIIRFLAMHKMNVYMPYIEDLFQFEAYPDFSKGRAPLTSVEVSQLDEYSELYHVQIIPIFETLGHMEDVLLKPEFEKYAEFPGSACVNISSDSTCLFMKTLLSEIAPAFSTKYFNMAADESSDVGLGASRQLVDSVGIGEAHAQYYKKIHDILKSLGKDVMMYGDIILKNPTILTEIPRDITIVDWEYTPSFNYPTVQKFKDAGFKFVVSPAVINYNRMFPNFYGSYANIEYLTEEGYETGAAGVIVSSWNDNGATDLRELNYPGYAWGAECAWNPERPSVSEFEDVFFRQYFETRSDLPRIIYELLSSTGNQISSYEFWRAPFIVETDRSVPTRAASISSSMPEVLSLITRARDVVKRNADILDLYELVANMNKYWADKVTGIAEIKDVAGDSAMTAGKKKTEITAIVDSLIAPVSRIENVYVKLYLRTNRRPMLQLIEARFWDQKNELIAGRNALLAGDSTFDQVLSSKFVYYPGSHPYTGGSFKIDSATFFKTIDIGTVAENDTLQLIGDTYCRLFINESYVGEVQARRTLTWDVEMKRVEVFDIASFLRQGKNTFVIQAINFDHNGSAGCNMFARIGSDTLRTDSTWQVTKRIISPDSLSTTDFKVAVPYDNGWLISAPKFSMGLKSWIER